MLKAYQDKLYPTRKQREALESQLGEACFLYSALVEPKAPSRIAHIGCRLALPIRIAHSLNGFTRRVEAISLIIRIRQAGNGNDHAGPGA